MSVSVQPHRHDSIHNILSANLVFTKPDTRFNANRKICVAKLMQQFVAVGEGAT
jgi:hypothetical protein